MPAFTARFVRVVLPSLVSCPVLFAFVFGVGGVACLGWSLWAIIRGREVRAWPITDGEVVTALIEEEVVINQGLRYLPFVQYRYEVAGKTYAGNRIQFGGRWAEALRHKDALEIAERHSFRRGHRIAVRYNPRDPDDAVLLVGTSPEGWAGVLVGALGLGLMLLIALT